MKRSSPAICASLAVMGTRPVPIIGWALVGISSPRTLNNSLR